MIVACAAVLVFSLWCVRVCGLLLCARAYGMPVVWACWWCARSGDRAGDVFVVYVWRSEDDGGEHSGLDADLSCKFIPVLRT